MSSKHGKVLRREPCPKCGSKDNRAVYEDGYVKCFGMGCGHYAYDNDGKTVAPATPVSKEFLTGESVTLNARGISRDTTSKWNYIVADYKGGKVQVANYYDEHRKLVAQKVRTPDKKFFVIGDITQAALYGEWLWTPTCKRIVVTEGELDALSVSEVQNNEWPVVSVPNGAAGAANAVRKSLEFLEKFEEVVFLFDQDEPGMKAAIECAELLSPGKAKIGSLPEKDANDMLVKGQAKELMNAIYRAKVHRPDGILSAEEVWNEVSKELTDSTLSYPWEGLNTMTMGLRKGELVTVCAGSGIGKSLMVKEIAHKLIQSGETVGYIALEESVRTTALSLMGISVNKPLHLNKDAVDEETFKTAFENVVGSGRVHFYDHFGSMSGENLVSRIRYMARGLGCQWVVLDHISIVVSGLSDGDERRIIDNLMTKLRSFVAETGIGLIVVSHLKRPQGDLGHEDGARTSLAQLRGSASIAQLSDIVIGLERNQQGADDEEHPVDPNLSTVRVLKNRYTGETGVATFLMYNKSDGRLYETVAPEKVGVFA